MPIDVTEFEMVSDVIPVAFSKALSPIDVTPSKITTGPVQSSPDPVATS
jgi:hypothetical protein